MLAPMIQRTIDSLCSFEGCNEPEDYAALCGGHAAQRLKGVELFPLTPNRYRDPSDIICHFPDCGRPRHAGDYCQGHAKQKNQGVELRPIEGKAKPVVECSFEGCTTVARQKGLCRGHRDQQLRGEELRPKIRLTQQKGEMCLMEDCGRPCRSRGLCKSHYNKLMKSGEASDPNQKFTCPLEDCNGTYTVRSNTQLCYNHGAAMLKYGLNREEAIRLLSIRECEICGSDKRLHIDHDHSCCPGGNAKKCGKCVRGVLCERCNHMIGNARDSVENLLGGVKYLEGLAR